MKTVCVCDSKEALPAVGLTPGQGHFVLKAFHFLLQNSSVCRLWVFCVCMLILRWQSDVLGSGLLDKQANFCGNGRSGSYKICVKAFSYSHAKRDSNILLTH